MPTYIADYLNSLTSTELAEVRAALELRTAIDVLAQSAEAASHTGGTNEHTFLTLPIAAGLMGVNDALRIRTFWSYTNSGNNKTPRVKLGGTSFLAAAQTTTASLSDTRTIQNRGVANSQISNVVGSTNTQGTSTSAFTTATVDTAAAQDLVISGQLASAGETITLEAYIVELIRAP